MAFGLIIISLLLVSTAASIGEPSACCSEISDHLACKNACDQVSVTSEEAVQLSQLSIMAENCPAHLVKLWQCIDSTFSAVSGGGGRWSGSKCCSHPLSSQCQNACNKASSAADLTENCPNTEIAFYRCVERQKWSTQCCNKAGNSSQCKAVCKAIFIQESDATPSQSRAVQDFCTDQVVTCIERKGITLHQEGLAPEVLQCCDMAHTPECQQSCRRAHTENTGLTEEEIYNIMEPQCGSPMLEVSIWQCFLTNNNNKHNRQQQYHVDGAKLLCCKKGKSKQCRDLCVKTHGQDWNRHYLKLMSCSANPVEDEMRKCLHEVEETCTMGCKGLDYCTNFNNRPTELFRSCNKMADEGARKEVENWQETGRISLPEFGSFSIPIKDISRCRPETWKTIACALQIKPCHLQGMRLCKEDCLSVLRDCIDYSLLPEVENTAEKVCDVLAPLDGQDNTCLALDEYIVPSPHRSTASEVSLPCQDNPCGDKEVCVLNRRRCKHPENCKAYKCITGCPVGDASSFYVPHQAYVRIPLAESDQLHCHRVCRCGHHHSLLGCTEADCTQPRQCRIPTSARIFQHGTVFQDQCNECVCHAGETKCTKRECAADVVAAAAVVNPERGGKKRDRGTDITGLPCHCKRDYHPVCGFNGRTYPSACIARCLGLKDRHFDSGACNAMEVCSDDLCEEGEVCVPRSTVCLDPYTYACRQFECVRMAEGCNQHHHDPVCDTRGEEWGNVCLMMSRGRTLAHRGHCLPGCRGLGGSAGGGMVCGVDGQTYSSECAAWANTVTVDYTGRCATVGVYAAPGSTETSCSDIQCPPLPSGSGVTCRPLTPPGACCPLCAGEIRLLYSVRLASTLAGATGLPPISVENVTQAFRRHLAVHECDVFAYLSIEGDMVLLVTPLSRSPTPLQVHACMVETEKLFTMFDTQNPTLTSYVAISPLLHAKLRLSEPIMLGSSSSASTNNHITNSWLLPLLALTLLLANHCTPHR